MFCDCVPGYVRVDPADVTSACKVSECMDSSECDYNQVCRQGRCKNSVCMDKCGPNTHCEASINNQAICTCKPGYYGLPDDKNKGCQQECGIRNKNIPMPLISGGYEAVRGEFPWQVALYERARTKTWQQHCGGTLISHDLVLTAAHCVVIGGAGKLEAADVKVGLGKILRDINGTEQFSVIASVKEVVAPLEYRGGVSSYAHDIALIHLSEKLQYNDYIRPACVDWDQTLRLIPGESVYVTGWGDMIKNSYMGSDVLLAAKVKYFDLISCLTKIPSILYDKICAESITGSQALKGDSGGGMVVERAEQYFVIGILSAGFIFGTDRTMYTNIAYMNHLTWLSRQRARLANESLPICYTHNECLADKMCFSNKCVDTCLYNICGENTTCQVREHHVFCDCLPGQIRVNPADVTSACRVPECMDSSDCGDDQVCRQGRCENSACIDKCGPNTHCIVSINNRAVCTCKPWYHGNPDDRSKGCQPDTV